MSIYCSTMKHKVLSAGEFAERINFGSFFAEAKIGI